MHLAQQGGSPDGDRPMSATRLVAGPRQTITAIIMESRNSPELLGPGELLFFVSNQ
jgi:hypothetical protein